MRYSLLGSLICGLLACSICLAASSAFGCTFSIDIDYANERAHFTACEEQPYDWDVYYAPTGSPGVEYLYTLTDCSEGEILLIDEGIWLMVQVETGASQAWYFTRHLRPTTIDPATLNLSSVTLGAEATTWGAVKELYHD